MKKQLFLFAAISLISVQIDASAAQRKAALREQIAKDLAGGSASSNAGGGSSNAGGNAGGPKIPTRGQMEAAVAANPADALAACQKAIANMNLQASGNPDSTVLNYIMG